jgi:hypothetical protein
MAMDFPASPTNGQLFTFAGVSYVWNGYAWISASAPPAIVPGHVIGEPSSGKAVAGEIGELIEQGIVGVGIPGLSAPFNIASITLTPGDWDISGYMILNGSPLTSQTHQVSISTTSLTHNNNVGWGSAYVGPFQQFYNVTCTIIPNQVLLNVNTTYYLVGTISYNAGGGTASGKIRARRMR